MITSKDIKKGSDDFKTHQENDPLAQSEPINSITLNNKSNQEIIKKLLYHLPFQVYTLKYACITGIKSFFYRKSVYKKCQCIHFFCLYFRHKTYMCIHPLSCR